MQLFTKQEKGEKTINKVVELPVSAIEPNPDQPRVIFDDYELSQLAVSIQQNGILQPLTVQRRDGFGYTLVSGERRLRAAKLLALEYVPCIIMEVDSRSSAVLAILENIQRSDLSFMEEAYAIRSLIEHYGMTQEEAAAKLGVAQSTVANKLRLLKLSDEEKSLIVRYKLNERQSRALLRLPGEKRLAAIEQISREQLNSLQTDKLVDELMTDKPKKRQHSFAFKQATLYINTINHAIDSMKAAGIACYEERSKTEEFMEYVLRIPLK